VFPCGADRERKTLRGSTVGMAAFAVVGEEPRADNIAPRSDITYGCPSTTTCRFYAQP
jgi:hypothetical protein